jgi:hypothetical protein
VRALLSIVLLIWATPIALGMPASATAKPHVVLLKIGDEFQVEGTRIHCGIESGESGKRIPGITCMVWSPGRNNVPILHSYAFSIFERGIVVFRAAPRLHAVFHVLNDPGIPMHFAPSDKTKGPRFAHLREGDAVAVARSDLTCVATGAGGLSLDCSRLSAAIIIALTQKPLRFRPLAVTLTDRVLRVWRTTNVKQGPRVIFARSEPRS